MRGMKQILGSLAVAGLMLASSVQVGATSAVASRGLTGSADGACRVSVSRNATAGVFKIARQTFGNGACRCVVTSGPTSQGGSAESAIAAVLTSRSCGKASLLAGPGGVTGGGLGGLGGLGGGLGGGLWTPRSP